MHERHSIPVRVVSIIGACLCAISAAETLFYAMFWGMFWGFYVGDIRLLCAPVYVSGPVGKRSSSPSTSPLTTTTSTPELVLPPSDRPSSPLVPAEHRVRPLLTPTHPARASHGLIGSTEDHPASRSQRALLLRRAAFHIVCLVPGAYAISSEITSLRTSL